MTNRSVRALLLRVAPALMAVVLLSVTFSAGSMPEGSVAKLISNPLVSNSPPGGPVGLPPVVCGGFFWHLPVPERDLGQEGILDLDMAIIPFRAGPMSVRLFDAQDARLLNLDFNDGVVNGLSYDRNGWNDVHVSIRAATQDYVLSVNGVAGGPFPLEAPCRLAGGCTSVKSLRIEAGFLEESTAWLDVLKLTLHAAGGAEELLALLFDGCGGPPVQMGAFLVTEPPRRIRN
jgi:hypothetical protein